MEQLDLDEFIIEINRILKNDGIVCIGTPGINNNGKWNSFNNAQMD
jgi:SAM-dependent methyltransferase